MGKLKKTLIFATAIFFSCLKKSNDKLNFTDEPDNKLTSLTEIIIEKTWAQQPNGYVYPIDIEVPESIEPIEGFPICVLLHSNGSNGRRIINQFSSVLDDHILIAPTGYLNSWNICDERSNAPDLEMVDELVNTLSNYSNINLNKIRILGSSNGAGLANNIFIQNENPNIDIICAVVSHLNIPQYHDNNFYKYSTVTNPMSAFCGYEEITNPISSRKYLSISNINDPTIPYLGGNSKVGLDFLNAEDAIFYIAKNQGFTGEKLPPEGSALGNPIIFEYSYLSGDVVHIKGNAMHSINPSQLDYLRTFFQNK
ncbi:hypothetical protein DEJ39_04040 [Bacteroidetes bacterium SCGC AAA795-G10]|nr:hypothetical protein DEJ39_04040 [Bacteroidetes bacterium SCGC AAA795-G10]